MVHVSVFTVWVMHLFQQAEWWACSLQSHLRKPHQGYRTAAEAKPGTFCKLLLQAVPPQCLMADGGDWRQVWRLLFVRAPWLVIPSPGSCNIVLLEATCRQVMRLRSSPCLTQQELCMGLQRREQHIVFSMQPTRRLPMRVGIANEAPATRPGAWAHQLRPD